jgi:hypothetical protein
MSPTKYKYRLYNSTETTNPHGSRKHLETKSKINSVVFMIPHSLFTEEVE